VEQEPLLIPMADLANHGYRRGPPQKTVRDDFGTRVSSQSSFAHGEEVVENYNETNNFLFLFHGFADRHNPEDCALVTLDPNHLPRCFSRGVLDWLSSSGMVNDAPCVNAKAGRSVAAFLGVVRAAWRRSESEGNSSLVSLWQGAFAECRHEARVFYAAGEPQNQCQAIQLWARAKGVSASEERGAVLRAAMDILSVQLEKMMAPKPSAVIRPLVGGRHATLTSEDDLLDDEDVWNAVDDYVITQYAMLRDVKTVLMNYAEERREDL
jgi:hypothetical protein